MNRIVIFGGTGAGKSTVARALAAKLGVAVSHLDALYYEPGWKAPAADAFRARVAGAVAGERWISEGNFLALTADIRLPRADTVLLIDQPRGVRLWRALRRGLAEYRARPDLAPGCRDHVNWELVTDVLKFDREYRPMIDEAMAQWAPATALRTLRGDRAVAAFLAAIPDCK
ncbi:MAG: topology modulation protein [Alphaproteobacteria bacterium]|nr:topology modulation protein [Alphaproteobacteria bacterium]